MRFFYGGGILTILYTASFAIPVLLPLVHGLALLYGVIVIIDAIMLFSPGQKLSGGRSTSKMWSLGDPNNVRIHLVNRFRFEVHIELTDEMPEQLQMRDQSHIFNLKSGQKKNICYQVTPNSRGKYEYGNIKALISTSLRLVGRMITLQQKTALPTFPGIMQMKKYELMAFAKTSTMEGIKKVRRLGHSYEFEQIKTYVQGDDIRSVNWKATGRRNQLMVNQYENERSQQVYSIIDKSRNMHMPFNGLTLLDYAINTSLVISNIVIKKYDKAGLISYSNTIGSTIKAERSAHHLKKIMQALYNEKARSNDANYDLLYRAVKNVVKTRSLLFLYLNFESEYNMERALPVLRKLSRMHLLVVVIFENTELLEYAQKKADYISEIYTQTMAQKLLLDKRKLVKKLRTYGVSTILSKPEDLSINTVNKYLELKSQGLI